MINNLEGVENSAIGHSALQNNTSGDRNIAIGHQAMNANTIGFNNVVIGHTASFGNQEGNNNTIIGKGAGPSTLNSTSGNIFIGYEAGSNELGNDKLYIENSNSSSPLIYGDFVSDKVGINGKLGVGTTNPSDVLHVVGTTGQNGLRVQVGSATKLRTFSNGGTAIGLNNSGGTPDDGLYVHGNTVLNADADINGDADIGGNTIINGTTQIGTNGTPFFEIKKISGTIGNPGTNAAYLSYPTGFDKATTFLISARLDGQFFFSTWSDPVDGIKNLTVQLNNDNIYVEVEGGTILGNGDAVELVLMKMN
jgi:NDP-sugar pyrophosphorylase family protein